MKKEALHKRDHLKSNKESFTLVLFNDDTNIFDHVIRSLVEICGHDLIQAEQCALIAHFRGRCEIKNGSRKLLLTMRKELELKGLGAEVESL
jgi:ATP-dependent Clp protease adaptor protein ClpS